MSNELGGLFDELAVHRVHFLSLYGNDDGFVHLVADHNTYSFLAKISFHENSNLVLFLFFCKDEHHARDVLPCLLDF